MVTSQSRDKSCTVLVDTPLTYTPPSGWIAQEDVGNNIQYHVDTSDKEKLNKLEGDIDFLRSMLIDLYTKCPKMKRDFGGNKKKVNKDDAVECENCGGLLW